MNAVAKQLNKKILEKKAKIAVIGLGYVGLPLAVELAKVGFRVLGVDKDKDRVRSVQNGKSYVLDISRRELQALVKKKRLRATSSFESLKQADVIVVCVPTPLNRTQEPDLQFVLEVTEQIAKVLHQGLLVIYESTTYPGTTDEVVQPRLESKKFRSGKDFFLCYSPERIDPANPNFKVIEIPKVIGGTTSVCTEVGVSLYSQILPQVHPVSSTRVAEMAKIIENTFRIVNIGLVNELAMISHGLGVDIWEAIEAASTKPFGYMPFFPGPGIGGHCIGIDPLYLSWKARTHGMEARFIDLASQMNHAMPSYIVDRLDQALNHRGKSLGGSRILIVGVTYKKDIDDLRESPALDVIEELIRREAKVDYHDPYISKLRFDGISLKSKPLTDSALSSADIVAIVTNHSRLDYAKIARKAKFIFDARNALKGYSVDAAKIVKL